MRPQPPTGPLILAGAHNYDQADIAWLRFEGYNPAEVVSEECEFGLRETDAKSGELVGLEYWRASQTLPKELLQMLPRPPVAVAG